MRTLKIISRGRRSEIFYYTYSTVLKLNDREFSTARIYAEFTKTKAVFDSKVIKVPEPLEVVTVENRTGIVFQKINGTALMELFQKKPWLYFSYTKKVCLLHKKLHEHQLGGLPSQVDEFKSILQESMLLTAPQKNRLLEILHKKYVSKLCHGDFHHGNIMHAGNEHFIIDWMDAFSGSCMLDVALTAVNTMVSTAPNHVPSGYRAIYDRSVNGWKLNSEQ